MVGAVGSISGTSMATNMSVEGSVEVMVTELQIKEAFDKFKGEGAAKALQDSSDNMSALSSTLEQMPNNKEQDKATSLMYQKEKGIGANIDVQA